jgi:hypothetical protein
MSFSLAVLLAILKNRAGDVYTKAQVDTAIATAITRTIIWKPCISSAGYANDIAALTAQYPDAVEGWTASISQSNKLYRYDFTTASWLEISSAEIPLASNVLDGRMSKEDFIKLEALPTGTSLSSALSAKENSLGNPVTTGLFLSSTPSGIRSWALPPAYEPNVLVQSTAPIGREKLIWIDSYSIPRYWDTVSSGWIECDIDGGSY